ncbi:hypothetical protein [Blastococcus sp. PRF04-17]|uniref:hypothetical protein n=1 Tax=Blastococcus sp. PRF04-17 TaxID=2933797 RepID=UPI001FF5D226|nr:hypothetical protein [Blastococcus sp. PRF04-17]UOY00407.1 hypothetical protein MVA48_15550 [Blastococcus sp. PRF04-17]
MSRVLLAGAAVVAAGAATSAFTASNTFDQTTSVVGYGEVTVTGIHVTSVTYNRLASDNGVLDNVEFATDHGTSLAGLTATMTLKHASKPTTNHSCAITGTAPTQVITCDGDGVIFDDFDTVGLTVGGA